MFGITIERLALVVTLQIAFQIAFFVALLTIGQPSAHAAELIMFERAGCPYCAAFDREIAPAYPLTDEGKKIPLRRVDMTRPVPSDLNFIRVERLVPVFVLVDAGREIGRIRGYAGEDHFWGMFGVLVERLRKQGAAAGAVGACPRDVDAGSPTRTCAASGNLELFPVQLNREKLRHARFAAPL